MAKSSKSQSPKKNLPIAVRIDAETKDALDELARADDRKTSDHIRRVLRQHIEQAGTKGGRRVG